MIENGGKIVLVSENENLVKLFLMNMYVFGVESC